MKTSNRDHRFQNLPATIRYSKKQIAFINSLKPFKGGEWDKSLSGTGRPRGAQARRNELKESIKNKLKNIQYPHCIYCGFHENIVGNLHREHIAPKEKYWNFVFEPENLALACANCNGFIKKNNYDTVSTHRSSYSQCTFKIIHPYRDRHQDHLDYSFSNNDLIVKAKPFSRKGKNTIKLFGLDDVRHTSLRGAALMKRHIKLSPQQEAIIHAALVREYTT